MRVLLLGATGQTGKLVLEQLLRKGCNPVIIGRNEEKLKALSEQFGGLTIAIADAQDATALRRIIQENDILISTVGPFDQLGKTPLAVAVESGAHYIDSSGEPSFTDHIYQTYANKLEDSKQVVMTSCGFDYVPGQLAAGKLMAEFGEQVSALNIVYSTGDGKIANLTSGTLSSFADAITETGTFYNHGSWNAGFIGAETFAVNAGRKRIKGIKVPALECQALPREYPQLRDVNVYLAWFGGLGGVMGAFNRVQHILFNVPGYRALTRRFIRSVPIPQRRSPDITARDHGPSLVRAEAIDFHGNSLGAYEISGHNMYYYTGEIIAWMATQLLAGDVKCFGVKAALQVFGLEALEKAHNDIGFVKRT